MAGALMVRAARVAAPYAGRALRIGAGYAGYALLDSAIEGVQGWIDRQEFQPGNRHRGLDLPAPVGTPVLAPTDAIVIGQQEDAEGGKQLFLAGPRAMRSDALDAERWPRPYAWFARGSQETGRDEIAVDDSGWRFGFAHLSGTNVQVGTVVRRGQQVATTGNTGKTTGPHLHLTTFWVQDGIRDIHTFVDPAILIPGIPYSVPSQSIGPGALVSVAILTRVSTGQQAMVKVVIQQMATGLGVNWAATVAGVQ